MLFFCLECKKVEKIIDIRLIFKTGYVYMNSRYIPLGMCKSSFWSQ